MRARNKKTGQECEIFWEMCDIGRRCEASDKPINRPPQGRDYNAVVDDYDLFVDGEWRDGFEFIKNGYRKRERR